MGLKSCNSMLLAILSVLMHLNFKIANAITLDDIDIDYINPDYVDMNTFNLTVDSKNKVTAVNLRLDIIKDIPSDVYIQVAASAQAFGHEIPTGLSFKSNLCGDKQAKAFFDIAVKPLGINECPPKMGRYEVNDLTFDFSKISIPIFKGGRIQFAVEAFAEETIKIVKMNVFVLT